MVEDRVTDPRRIAELLASEVTGRSQGALAWLTVVDADRAVRPGPDGPVAYRIAADSPADSGAASQSAIATVRLFERAVCVTFPDRTATDSEGTARPPDSGRAGGRDDLAIETAAAGLRIEVRSGAAVKPAVDAIEAAVGD